MALMGHQIGKALCEALGLPKYTRSFTLRCEVGQIVTAECEYHPDIDTATLETCIAKFELHRKADEPREEAPLNFDTWMRERTERAHTEYMQRLSSGIFKPWATGGFVANVLGASGKQVADAVAKAVTRAESRAHWE